MIWYLAFACPCYYIPRLFPVRPAPPSSTIASNQWPSPPMYARRHQMFGWIWTMLLWKLLLCRHFHYSWWTTHGDHWSGPRGYVHIHVLTKDGICVRLATMINATRTMWGQNPSQTSSGRAFISSRSDQTNKNFFSSPAQLAALSA